MLSEFIGRKGRKIKQAPSREVGVQFPSISAVADEIGCSEDELRRVVRLQPSLPEALSAVGPVAEAIQRTFASASIDAARFPKLANFQQEIQLGEAARRQRRNEQISQAQIIVAELKLAPDLSERLAGLPLLESTKELITADRSVLDRLHSAEWIADELYIRPIREVTDREMRLFARERGWQVLSGTLIIRRARDILDLLPQPPTDTGSIGRELSGVNTFQTLLIEAIRQPVTTV